MIVLIPAYEPDGRLAGFVAALARRAGVHVLVIDDGSGPAFDDAFRQAGDAGALVERCAVNRGKGAALKHGFALIRAGLPGFPPADAVVCADSDGQHALEDVLRVGTAVACTGSTVLGVRRFSGNVPLRSRVGNGATRALLGLATRRDLVDTQTGLRGYPPDLLPWLCDVPGTRYEYETRLLLAFAATGWLLGSAIVARMVSSTFNFAANRRFVFTEATTTVRQSAVRYWALVVALLAANDAVLATLTVLGIGLVLAKLLAELGLFLAGYAVQRLVVFGVPHRPRGAEVRDHDAVQRHVVRAVPRVVEARRTRLAAREG